ncbi:unnamed protein product [Notodromas monacha]|uniref:Chromatin-remodeling ATPase INO80 n=1 Tax=Notodromas monacha TaxID=399045 RepID=A0A7R9BKK5_9CRUS|nr:unnamed protein product [Notodromas monacha]CAG0916948.1 unnamed protein product [Notodromas monacha]
MDSESSFGPGGGLRSLFKSYADSDTALPLQFQRLERAVRLDPLLDQMEAVFKELPSDEESSSSDDDVELASDITVGERSQRIAVEVRQEKIEMRKRFYNFSGLADDRKWIKDFLLDISSDEDLGEDEEEPITEDEFQSMFRHHVRERRFKIEWSQEPEKSKFMYYCATVLRKGDEYHANLSRSIGMKLPGVQAVSVMAGSVNRKSHAEANSRKEKPARSARSEMTAKLKTASPVTSPELAPVTKTQARERKIDGQRKRRGKSREQKELEEAIARRKKQWLLLVKKDIHKGYKIRMNIRRDGLQQSKKMAQMCLKYRRQEVMTFQRPPNSVMSLCKRLTKEMLVFWKKHEKVERELRRKVEKEIEEQRQRDMELLEAKRQQRKLNFLITQTELYAHFLSRKLSGASAEDGESILRELDDNSVRLQEDDYDADEAKRQAVSNVTHALELQKSRIGSSSLTEAGANYSEDCPQASIFCGSLKEYQLKGISWLANLYSQGISGILADEMGLGKTVQALGFLAHIAERYDVWGPFLIVAPASTLHNWEQEASRFVPSFRVVPYWGSPGERKILRQFWSQGNLSTKDSLFHVMITSYQLVVSDFKYFQKLQWQYMILDEAQAIKSTNSQRWKTLLGFQCRNRLLLSGTPIQNSMAELWALLHFIMPTLFDSHAEFNEWFSKDVEGHAENRTTMDSKHLSRLHMIMKPFMLRRTKKDVENEFSEKVEVMIHCSLTRKQRLLYQAMKRKISVDDLVRGCVQGDGAAPITTNLMNLVMQFRKVCNHPSLFERNHAKSSLVLRRVQLRIPKKIYHSARVLHSSRCLTALRLFPVFDPYHAQSESMNESSMLSFCHLFGMSLGDLLRLFVGSKSCRNRWQHAIDSIERASLRQLDQMFHPVGSDDAIEKPWEFLHVCRSKYVQNFSENTNVMPLVFVTPCRPLYAYLPHKFNHVLETEEHRRIRLQRKRSKAGNECLDETTERKSCCAPEGEESEVHVYENVLSELPSFLFSEVVPKVMSCGSTLWCSCWHLVADMWRETSLNWQKLVDDTDGVATVLYGRYHERILMKSYPGFTDCVPVGGVEAIPAIRKACHQITFPDVETLISDSGKMQALDLLLNRLRDEGHRVLIYSQMTRMIDILEEYMCYRRHSYVRLDGSSKIADRRDMVAGFQARSEIFAFLLSTRAGGLGINLTAADTVIFYDSDWNPTVDQQAMDRAHRLGQTKQVTVYRLICKDSIEERILQRAQEKSEIHRMVISGGSFRADALRPQEVVSILLDDAEMEEKFNAKQEERRAMEEQKLDKKKRGRLSTDWGVRSFDPDAALEDGLQEALASGFAPKTAKRAQKVSLKPNAEPKKVVKPRKTSSTYRKSISKTSAQDVASVAPTNVVPTDKLDAGVDSSNPRPNPKRSADKIQKTDVRVNRISKKVQSISLTRDEYGEFVARPNQKNRKRPRTSIEKETAGGSGISSENPKIPRLAAEADGVIVDDFQRPSSAEDSPNSGSDSGRSAGRRQNRASGFYRQLHISGRKNR